MNTRTYCRLGSVVGLSLLTSAAILSGFACSKPIDSTPGVTRSSSLNLALKVDPAVTNILPSSSVTISASSGTPPYRFSLVSGGGVLVNVSETLGVATFVAPKAASESEVSVTDAKGALVTARILVSLTLAPTPAPSPTPPVLPSATPTPVPGSTPTPTPVPVATVDVYRFYNTVSGEHFLSLSSTEAIGITNFVAEGAHFKVVSVEGVPGTVAIYRCFWTPLGRHFVSADPGCEGFQNEGRYGFVYQNPSAGRKALYRYYSPVSYDHLITTQASEVPSDYQFEGSFGYVP